MKIRVIELFAGVGGFRLGLQRANATKSNNSEDRDGFYEIVWSNQWEPQSRIQHASDVYRHKFENNGHSNEDINEVMTKNIPDAELLVAGFPCQDYSVATTLRRSGGLLGKKGVLWWNIYKILKEKGVRKPEYLILENVDRLLKSPIEQRGRDFAIILASLSDLGYAVEWRVINAGDYGFPQRRKRIFILAYHKSTPTYQRIKRSSSLFDWITNSGVLSSAFPCDALSVPTIEDDMISGNLEEITNNFNKNMSRAPSPFKDSGVIIEKRYATYITSPDYHGSHQTLGSVLLKKRIPDEYVIPIEQEAEWKIQKGSKKLERKNKETGHLYTFSEGSMVFPDRLERPSRTIITSEGGSSPSRFRHAVPYGKDRNRRLTPIELERLNTFPDDFTKTGVDEYGKHYPISPSKRAFLMGNALVVDVVKKIGIALKNEIRSNE